ncbi:MFS transporter, partial [Streptomyces sp. SID11233]|nr:MFS transporter [Streptomyces sp. SID11233]
VVLALALRHVPESRDPAATGRFDWAGAVLGAAFLAGVSYALITAKGASPGRLLVPLAVGLAAGAAFLVV